MLQAVIFGVPAIVDFDGACVVQNDSWYEGATNEQTDLFKGAKTALDEQVPQRDIMSFNDDSTTTRSDVLAVFKKAYRRAQYIERKARALQAA